MCVLGLPVSARWSVIDERVLAETPRLHALVAPALAGCGTLSFARAQVERKAQRIAFSILGHTPNMVLGQVQPSFFPGRLLGSLGLGRLVRLVFGNVGGFVRLGLLLLWRWLLTAGIARTRSNASSKGSLFPAGIANPPRGSSASFRWIVLSASYACLMVTFANPTGGSRCTSPNNSPIKASCFSKLMSWDMSYAAPLRRKPCWTSSSLATGATMLLGVSSCLRKPPESVRKALRPSRPALPDRGR